MFKSKRWLLASLSFVLIFAGSGFLLAAQDGPRMPPPREGPGMGPPMGPPGMPALREIVRGLELTDEQRAQIREILEGSRNQIEQARRNIIQAQENLDADFQESAEILGAAYAEEALLRAQILKQVKQLLTAEQLNLLEERRQMRKERHDKFPGPFGEGFE